MSLIQRLKSILPSSSPPPVQEDGEQEALFKIRYQIFRRLLAANNAALDIMTDLEEAAHGHRHFGMHFLRSRTTALTAKVYTIVENMCRLAPGKYEQLPQVMRTIQAQIQEELQLKGEERSPERILDLSEITAADKKDVGGKMANLGELRNVLHMPVPDGFAVTTQAYEEFIRQDGLWDEINCLLLGHSTADQFIVGGNSDEEDAEVDSAFLLEQCAKVQNMILAASVPAKLEEEILSAYDRLCEREGEEVHVALRSSAVGEDSAGASFAGQHRSLLNLERDSLIDGYKEVVASKYSAHAISYRYMRGIRDDEERMAVGCLSMARSQVSGVTYTVNPLNQEDKRIHITSAWGMGKGVVDGTAVCDQFVVEKGDPLTIVERDVSIKDMALVRAEAEGLSRVSVDPELRAKPTLDDSQILRLAEAAVQIEAHYGAPQDIEWTFTPRGQLVMLQARPLEVHQQVKGPVPTTPPLLQEGRTAAPGAACGVVHFLQKDVDILTLPENAILVCTTAAPKWAVVLNKCAGLITEQGSVAGHLANVAREFGVPALFGVSEAMSRFTAGQEITLDADNTAVYAGRQEEVLGRKPKRPNMMEGSPVFQTLLRVNRFITPLNLLDPDSLEFRPSNCQTLHDITRFCHEKSVVEMFNFGRDHDFSPRSSKQLKTVAPMQWWIINLDDGFIKETGGKMVLLGNIASIPMLAIWRGIVAFPWEGPPSLDGKGFLSVLFQSVTNTNLEPAAASSYAERNYFMISKHFCNLQSRFGYHFTSVEALAGPRPRENYIRFQFKGGAADFHRRERRTRFVGEILDEFGFQTQTREDALFARLDDCEQSFIEKRLEILGHMLIHTRQLDMIMANEDVVEFYKNHILGQLQAIMDNRQPIQ